ncbi:IS21 family transposase [Aliibacillus thermotolerans]|uniref:IS21 family transposase n=2 Tax=Aliibacillus thermotolerans TaxID=1834418 RepID=A0ABW0U7X3_9BACI
MLAMPEINHIKKLRNDKSLSINEISRRTGFCWSTVKKYADNDQLPEEKIPVKKGMMYEEKWGEIVIDWLLEDYALKKKLRRKNTKIFEQLQELGFPGSYRTVCNFIKEWKDKTLDEADEMKEEYERLTHPPAEAQVDFGITEAVEDGKVKDIHCLIMSFPYSNGGLAVPLPSENQECFLEGLKVLFKQAEFVPRKLRLDNLSAAVVKARSRGQETIFTDAFQRFASHYGFEAQACNPRKGNEKGHVENKVGYVRYNFFTPSPVIKNLAHLRELLFEKCKDDHQRLHYKKGVVIADLLEEEKKYGLALPEADYPVFKQSMVTANKYGEVRIDGALIHVPQSYITVSYI